MYWFDSAVEWEFFFLFYLKFERTMNRWLRYAINVSNIESNTNLLLIRMFSYFYALYSLRFYHSKNWKISRFYIQYEKCPHEFYCSVLYCNCSVYLLRVLSALKVILEVILSYTIVSQTIKIQSDCTDSLLIFLDVKWWIP